MRTHPRNCPDHPMQPLGECDACERDAAHTDNAAGVAAVRQALRSAPRPVRDVEPAKPDNTRDLAVARARADKETR